MQTMSTLLNSEKLIRESFVSNDALYHLTCCLFIWHFKAVDAVEQTSHCRTINYLYMQRNTKYTKECIASETYSNTKTLKRDRECYIAYFDYFYQAIKDRNFTAESAITSLY